MRASHAVVVALAGAATLLVGGGVALADGGGDARAERCHDRLARVAERRGVSADVLQARLEARLGARIDAALAAGRISPGRAARLQERIARHRTCTWPGVSVRLARRALVRAAARYLELRPARLRAELHGTSLETLARQRGKSVEGLQAAMVAPAKARLDRAVEAGRIGRARADAALARIEALVARLVTRTIPAR